MKLYTFLKKPDDEMLHDDTIPLEVKYSLYAITPTKKDAKIFKKSRNMDKFIMRVIDIDEEDGYDEYMIHNRGKILSWYWLESYRNKNTKNQEPFWVHVLITENELNFTIEMTDSGAILNRLEHVIPIEYFEGEMKEALYDLRYDKVVRMVMGMQLINQDTELNSEAYEYYDSFFDTGIKFDMFAVFLLLYEDTFSTDFFTFTEISNTQPTDEL